MHAHSDSGALGASTRGARQGRGLSAALGLVTIQEAWQARVSQSLPYRAIASARAALYERLAPLAATSLAVKLAPLLSLASACLLLLASPYVGTGLNALMVLLAFGTFLFQWIVEKPVAKEADGLDLPFLAFLAASIVAVGFSPYLLLSVKGLAKMLVFWMSFLAFRGALRRGERGWLPLFGALFVAAFAQSLYGIYQWKIQVAPLALWDDAEAEVKLTRVYGTLGNPNLLSGYLIPIIPFAVAAAVTWKAWGLRLLAIGTALTAPVCLYFTYSRGAYLGMVGEAMVFGALGLAALWPAIRRRPWLLAVLAGILALGAVAAVVVYHHSPAMQERLLSITATRTHSSNSFRMNVWDGVIRMIKDSWWFGIGLGNDAFRKVYALYMVSGFEALGAYNIFLEEMVEKGILGLLAFVALVGGAIFRALHHFKHGVSRPWAVAAIAALVGLMIHGMVDTVFYRPSVQILFWLTLAVVIHLPHRIEGAA
ncbi:MAG TPA: O-antigen ligase family protein [Pantanalinema sp.]